MIPRDWMSEQSQYAVEAFLKCYWSTVHTGRPESLSSDISEKRPSSRVKGLANKTKGKEAKGAHLDQKVTVTLGLGFRTSITS